MTKYKYSRLPYLVVFQEQSKFKETYGGDLEVIALEAHRLIPELDGKPVESKTAIVFMHPVGGGAYLPMVGSLAKKGYHVIYCNSRYRGNDSALIMEKVALDLGHCIRHAKEQLGYEKIILAGWSGGGSLSLFYQAEAENPTVTETPAGDEPSLVEAGLVPADGVMLLAAHISRAHTLTEWIDPSVVDENNPYTKDPELDLYNPGNRNQPPYNESFINRYREAQIARNRKITAWVRDELKRLKDAGRENDERAFVVHGTMADPRWLDPSIDRNDRKPNWCYLGDPEVVNNGPVGLARFCTLRAWLSQWSYDDSNADGQKCAARISVPALVVGNSADDACTPSHTVRLYEAIGHENKEMHEIQGANHYYFGQPDKVEESASLCVSWLNRHGF